MTIPRLSSGRLYVFHILVYRHIYSILTLIFCTQDFTVDATVGVIQDSRFKKLDAFSDLASACSVKAVCSPVGTSFDRAEIFDMD